MVVSKKNPIIRAHILVTGRVQGVGFRYNTLELAQSLGISGWVRNTENSAVEIIAQGQKDALEKFVEKIKKGFFSGNIKNCSVEFEELQEKIFGFEIRH